MQRDSRVPYACILNTRIEKLCLTFHMKIQIYDTSVFRIQTSVFRIHSYCVVIGIHAYHTLESHCTTLQHTEYDTRVFQIQTSVFRLHSCRALGHRQRMETLHLTFHLTIQEYDTSVFQIQTSVFRVHSGRKKPPPRGGFLFTMFSHQVLCVGGPPSKNLVQILRGGSAYTRFLMREHSK